ncbi:MAG: PAS domain S-box protein [Ardenticatenaceae bacterium]|nr:PAS domain S-box protein [Ardenticatenaceae bacterium]
MSQDLPQLFDLAPEQALAYLFDRLPVGTAVIDRAFRLRRCNPTWAEFIDRYTPSSSSDVVPGVSLFDLEPGTEDVLKPLFAPVFAGETVRQEGIRLESGGIVSYWDVVLVPLEFNGEIVAALDVSLDATAHVRNKRKLQNTLNALQQSEAHLRSMLESAQGYAIYRLAVDPDHPYQGRVVLVSPSIRDVIGIADPYDFNAWFNDIHPNDEARIIAANQRAIDKGMPFDEEMRIFNRQRGQWRWMHTVSNPVLDENGRITYFNGITIDITEQKQAQETLAQINQVLEQQVAERTEEMERRWQESERRRQVAESLRGIMRVLNSQHPLSEVLDYIIQQASQVMEAEISLLYRIDYEQQFMHIDAQHGLPTAVQDVTGFPLLDTLVDQQIMARKPAAGLIDHTVQRLPSPGIDPAIVLRWHDHVTDRHNAFLAIPLVVRDTVYGRLTFYYARQRSFDQEDIDQAMLFGDQVALAIENAQLRADAKEMAVIGERHRLARELHDAVTQTLFSASLIADVLPRIWQRNPEMGAAKLEELRELTRGALAEMRTLLLELRPATLTESSLEELLRQLAAAVIGRSRLQVDVAVEGERQLSPETQVTLYRIAQEALNNIIKHAGASQVTIGLRFLPDCVELVVVDNGHGFDPTAVSIHSLGLGIMRERAAKIKADLQIESIIGQGTTITVRVCP